VKATIHFDGACVPNPGPMGIGATLDGPDGVLWEISEKLEGIGTNNIAEYTALIRAMQKAKELGVKDLVIKGDSNLVIQQLNGKFRVREPRLRPLLQQCLDLAREFTTIEVQWVPREQNKRADALSFRPFEPAKAAPGREALGTKPAAREHSILCPRCNKPCTLTIQTFKDGSDHIRQECPDHGYVGYAPNVEPFLTLARKGSA
jgi:ribonuclease HI